MSDNERLTKAKIDELLLFLPGFEEPDRQSFADWQSYYPVYDSDVVQFFRLAGDPWWMDTDYDINEAGAMLADDAVIGAADLAQIKTVLTFVVRGERFADGHRENLLKNGRVQSLLRRLQSLRDEMNQE